MLSSEICGGMTRTHGSRRVPRVRALACSVALVAAFGAASCGGSDDSDGDGAAAPANAAADRGAQAPGVNGNSSGPAPGTPEYDVRAGYAIFLSYLEVQSAAGACGKLTDAFRRRIGGGWEGCLRRVAALLAGGDVTKGDREVVSVDVHDADAATGRVKTAKGIQQLRFKRERGLWRIDAGNPWR